MALIHRFFCMMVAATFSYNTRHSGGAVPFQKNYGSKKSARGADEDALVLPKKVRRRRR